MDDGLRGLNDAELDLMGELEPERLAELNEDGLLALHKRVRKARNKRVSRYRRDAAGRVEESGGRGIAAPHSDKARLRASVFEEALSRVSAELARVAHAEAEALKDERLAQAREGRGDASSQSQGAKRQAKSDS